MQEITPNAGTLACLKEKILISFHKFKVDSVQVMYLFFIQGSEQGPTSQEQALSAQHAAVINLAGVGSFMQSQAAGSYHQNFICWIY